MNLLSRRVTGTLLWLSIAGCATADSNGEVIDIEITHRRAGSSWEVFYALPSPVAELRFARHATGRADWSVQSAGVRLERRDGVDWLVAEADTGFSAALLHVQSAFEHRPDDYELTVAFSDGALLLYTGHFDIVDVTRPGAPRRFTLRPAPGERVVLRGETGSGAVSEVLRGPDPGTFAYFGSSRPMRTSIAHVMVDGELPGWIRERFDHHLPRLFEFYERATDRELGFTPQVFFAYAPGDPSVRSLSGGALPGMIQMSARGTGWWKEDPDGRFTLLNFIAHEAAHLWNSQEILHDGGQDAAWMHEGGADAWALRALAALDLLSADQVVSAHVEAANECARALGRRSLASSTGKGTERVVYTCGSTVAWITEGAVRRTGSGADLFDFWRRLFDRARGTRGYTEAMYLETLEEMTGDAALTAAVRRLVDERVVDPVAYLERLFVQTLLPVKRVGQRFSPVTTR